VFLVFIIRRRLGRPTCEDLVEIEYILAGPRRRRPERELQLERRHDGPEELLANVENSLIGKRRRDNRLRIDGTYLRINKGVLRARDEHEALYLGKVGEFGRIELSDADCVRFFVSAGYDFAKMRDKGKI
jgi:hypothetical protein